VRGGTGGQPVLQHRELRSRQTTPRTAGPLGGQRRPASSLQRSTPPVRRHPTDPEPPSHLAVIGPRLDQLGGSEPHLLPPGPFHGGQPTTIGIPHINDIANRSAAVTNYT